jgi:hypothetical protein
MLPPRLAVLYVQHSPERYPDALPRLREYLERLWFCQPFLLRVDNRNPQLPYTALDAGSAIVGGDNRDREFSGWQRGWEVLRAERPGVDMVLLCNEAFLAPGPSFLEKYPSLEDLSSWHRRGLVAGRLDAYDVPVSLHGFAVDSWACTNTLFVPRRALEDLGTLATIREEDLREFLPDACPTQLSRGDVLKLHRSEVEDGEVGFEYAVPRHANLLISFDAGRGVVPRERGLGADGRALGMYIGRLQVGDQEFGDAIWKTGWYSEAEEGWAGPQFSIAFANLSPGPLKVHAWIPPGFLNRGASHMEVRVEMVGDPFLPRAPMSLPYRFLLLEWLTRRWRRRFALRAETWPLFRDKLRAILNESSLSRRLRNAGYDVVSYGAERFY